MSTNTATVTSEPETVKAAPLVRLPGAAATEAAALISMIERAAADPNIDIDRVERMYAMYERAAARNAKAAYISALSDMQPKLPIITRKGGIKDKHGNVQSKYALWEDVVEAIAPVLAAHGFSITFRTSRDGDKISVTGVLGHRDGHTEETTMVLPIDATGSKNAVQAIGSSTSYGKRYTAFALLNIAARGEDDDGKGSDAPETISEEQETALREMIEATDANLMSFCSYFKITKLSDMTVDTYHRAMVALEKKARTQ